MVFQLRRRHCRGLHQALTCLFMRISANMLAEFILANQPERRVRLVEQVRHSVGHPLYYRAFEKPAREFLTGGARNALPLLALIERLEGKQGKQWHLTDAKITIKAIRSLIAMGPQISALGVEFGPSPKRRQRLAVEGVSVSVPPHLLICRQRKGLQELGALRFYTAQDSNGHFGVHGAQLVAAMEYLWLHQTSQEATPVAPSACMVLEVFQGRITALPEDPAYLVHRVEQGAKDFAAIWQRLDAKSAA